MQKKILLVDNDKDDQLFFMEAVGAINKAILLTIARNGKEALDILENGTKLPDIIFMEIFLPVMSGIECLEKITNKPLIKEIPVVIISASTGEIELARKLGAKAFVKKAPDRHILRSKIEQIINLDLIADNAIATQTFQAAL